MYRVYKYTFPDGMIYIGRTKLDIRTRYYNGYRHNKRLTKAFKFYSWEKVKKEILADNLTEEEADAIEIEQIRLQRAQDPDRGYNVSPGGKLGFFGLKHTDTAKIRMSLSGTGKHSGEKHPFFGKKHTKEEIERFRAASVKRMKPIIQRSLDGEFIKRYESVSAAARAVGTTQKNIRCCIQGASHHACGYKWEYANDTFGKCN